MWILPRHSLLPWSYGFKECITVNSAKIVTIVNWMYPTTVTEVWSFLRLAYYYYIFVEEFSKIAASLTHLTRKDVKFE